MENQMLFFSQKKHNEAAEMSASGVRPEHTPPHAG